MKKKKAFGMIGLVMSLWLVPTFASAATSGSEVFKNNCMACHGNGGVGGRAPTLVGESFIKHYPTNGDLYEFVKKNMPLRNPGSLTDAEYQAVASYIGELNGRKAAAAPSTNANQTIKVFVNGRQLTFPVNPVIKNGTTLVPLTQIFQALGATVQWEAKTKTITAKKGTTKITLTIGKTSATVKGKTVSIAQAPQIIQSRTFVPLRFISEALGSKVQYDSATKTITIN